MLRLYGRPAGLSMDLYKCVDGFNTLTYYEGNNGDEVNNPGATICPTCHGLSCPPDNCAEMLGLMESATWWVTEPAYLLDSDAPLVAKVTEAARRGDWAGVQAAADAAEQQKADNDGPAYGGDQ